MLLHFISKIIICMWKIKTSIGELVKSIFEKIKQFHCLYSSVGNIVVLLIFLEVF